MLHTARKLAARLIAFLTGPTTSTFLRPCRTIMMFRQGGIIGGKLRREWKNHLQVPLI
jgi:hypothetical protein